MSGPSENPLVLFPSNPDVSLDFVSGNIRTLDRENKTNCFPRDLTLSV